MKSLKNGKNLLMKVVILILLLNTMVIANISEDREDTSSYMNERSMIEVNAGKESESIEVSLDSFSTVGIVILIALSSLLGLFFMRDELNKV